MPSRIPLIFNTATNKIEEIVTTDSMQLDMQSDFKVMTETVVGNYSPSITTLSVTSGTVTIDTSLGSVFTGTLSAAVTTWAFTNVPTTNGKVITITLILQGTSTLTYGDACSVNASSISNGIKWSGGSAPAATNNIDILSFIIMRDNQGTVIVIGNSTTNIS